MTVPNLHAVPDPGTASPGSGIGTQATRRPQTRGQSYHAIALIFLDVGTSAGEMRAYEHTYDWDTPVADAMGRILERRGICAAAARRVPCRLTRCRARAGLPCTPDGGLHVIRLSSARRQRVISTAQMTALTGPGGLLGGGGAVVRPDQDGETS